MNDRCAALHLDALAELDEALRGGFIEGDEP